MKQVGREKTAAGTKSFPYFDGYQNLIDAEKVRIKESIVADIQRPERLSLEINAVKNKTDNTLKQSGNDFLKKSVTENEFYKLENNQP